MHPILSVLRVGGIERPIGSYGVMLAVALATASALMLRSVRRARLDEGAVIAVLGLALLGGFGGGWALHALVRLGQTGSLPLALGQPGLAYFGALIGGCTVALWAARALSLPAGRLFDLSVVPLAVGHSLGRVGCFLGGCCYGRPFDGAWAVHYTHPLAPAAVASVGRHPTPLYEAALLLLLAGIGSSRRLPVAPDGQRFIAFVAAYAVLRLAMETLRGDAVRGLWWASSVSTSQLIALFLLVACGAYLGAPRRGLGAPRRSGPHDCLRSAEPAGRRRG